ncbi:hypothetical protein GcM3_061031, partial [Golovinomyces cichoracearum]
MTFSPLTEWHTRPRVLNYVRKARGLYLYQTAVYLSSDCIQISISIGRERKIGVWNFYNAPAKCRGAGEGLKLLLKLPDSPEFVGGDINLRHPVWDSQATSSSNQAVALIEWAREKDLCILNPTDTPTHNRSGTLDIAFCSLVGAKCKITSEFRTKSDHETIVTTIPLCGDLVESKPKRL